MLVFRSMLNDSISFKSTPEEKSAVEDALYEAGFPATVKPPRVGTPAYNRLMAAAQGYMVEVKRVEQAAALPIDPIYSERDDYFRTIPNPMKKESDSSSSDKTRRQFHDTLTMMLLGKPRKGLPKPEADMVSNFAAYLTGDEEYIDKW